MGIHTISVRTKVTDSLWLRYLAAVVSALLMTVAFPPHNLGWIAWFGLVPFFLAVQGLKRPQTYTVVAVWFLVFFACMVDFYFFSRSPLFVLIITMGIFLQIFIVSELQLLTTRFSRWGWLLFSGLWIGIWFLLSFVVGLLSPIPPDLPFFSFANTQWLYPTMLQILPVVGEYGLALLIVLFNRGLVQVILNRQQRQWLMPLVVILTLLVISVGWGTYRLSTDIPAETVGVAVMPIGGTQSTGVDAISQTRDYIQYIDSNPVLPDDSSIPKIEIVAWAEMPVGDLTDTTGTTLVSNLADEMQRYLVTDVTEAQVNKNPLNVAVVFSPDGKILAQNAKRKIPPIVDESTAGDKNKPSAVVATPWGRMSTLVCYDTLFPDVVRKEVNEGVDFIIVPANATSDSVPRFTALHLAQTIFRAAENHSAFALAYSGGISALIDANGRLLIHESLYKTKHAQNDMSLAGALPVGVGGSIYTKIGDLFTWVVLIVCLAGLFIFKIRKAR